MTDPVTHPAHCVVTDTDVHRLSVNINDETAKTLCTVMAERNWSATEAVRRAVAYLDLAERVRRSGGQFVVTPPARES